MKHCTHNHIFVHGDGRMVVVVVCVCRGGGRDYNQLSQVQPVALIVNEIS